MSLSIGAAGDYNLQIGNNIYRLLDLFSKTIYAAKPLNVYATTAGVKVVGKLKPGDPIGTVRGYYPQGRGSAKRNYLLIGPNSKDLKAVEYAADNFNEDKLLAQGVVNAKQDADITRKLQEEANTPWYMKITKVIVPIAGLGLVAYFVLTKKKSE